MSKVYTIAGLFLSLMTVVPMAHSMSCVELTSHRQLAQDAMYRELEGALNWGAIYEGPLLEQFLSVFPEAAPKLAQLDRVSSDNPDFFKMSRSVLLNETVVRVALHNLNSPLGKKVNGLVKTFSQSIYGLAQSYKGTNVSKERAIDELRAVLEVIFKTEDPLLNEFLDSMKRERVWQRSAQTNELTMLALSPFLEMRFEVEAVPGVSLEVAHRVHEPTIKAVESILGKLQKPRNIRIKLSNPTENQMDSSAGHDRDLFISHRSHPISVDGKPYDPVTAHEFGHLIFTLNFKVYLEGTVGFQAYSSLVKERIEALKARQSSLEPGSNSYFEFIKEKGKVSELEQWEMRFRNTELISAFDELFADYIAVARSGSNSAMADAFKSINPELAIEFQQQVNARDFSQTHKLINWSETEAHAYFGPVRTYLGRILTRVTVEQRGRISEILLQSIAEETAYYLTQTQEQIEISPKEANLRLIRRIRENLLKVGV